MPFMTLRIINASFHKQYYQIGICNAHAGIFCELQAKFLNNNMENTPTTVTMDEPGSLIYFLIVAAFIFYGRKKLWAQNDKVF